MIKEELIFNKGTKSPLAESYRIMRTNIMYSSIDKKVKTIAMTSSGPGEGKSTTVSNFAIAMAQAGSKVLIIDSDLRKPRIHKNFGLSNTLGLTNILVGDFTEDRDVLGESDYKLTNVLGEDLIFKNSINVIEELPKLHVMTSGPIPPNPSEMVGSEKMKKLIDSLKGEYDYVIIDTPPVGVVTDAAIISSYTDGVILVVASGNVEIEAAKRAKALLTNVNANILGAVLNRVPTKGSGYYKYYYYSYYHEDGTEGNKGSKKIRRRLKHD